MIAAIIAVIIFQIESNHAIGFADLDVKFPIDNSQ